MDSKQNKCSIVIQYSVALLLSVLFIGLILFASMYVLRLDHFLLFSDTSCNAFLASHISILTFIYYYYHYILIGIGIVIIAFELKYEFKNKATVRLMALSISVLLLNVFTISYLFGIMDVMYSAIYSPNMMKIMQEKREEISDSADIPDSATPSPES